MANLSNFFEIPVSDFSRASKFYGQLFDVELHPVDFHGTKMSFFPKISLGDATGAIVCGDGYKPSTEGSLVYLDGGPNLTGRLNKIEKLGGKVIVQKTKISDEAGYFAQFIDTEGNRLALHSMG